MLHYSMPEYVVYTKIIESLDMSWDQGRWSLIPDSLDIVPWKATALKRWIVADGLWNKKIVSQASPVVV